MTGISSAITKFSCPMYNTSAYPTSRSTRTNNTHIIPPKSSTPHLQTISPILATTHLLKHRVNSSSTGNTVSSRFDGNDFLHMVKDIADGEKAKRAFPALEIPMLAFITFMAVACGVNVKSILAVGGLATAFAVRHIFGNFLSGEIIQDTKLFSIGDRVEVSSHVLDVGLMTTSLLSAEMSLIVVPNLLFFSEGFMKNEWSRWHAMVSKIDMEIDEFEKIPEILEEIRNMMKSNSHVFLESGEYPYCYVSRVERSFAELTLGCNLKMTSRDNLYSAQKDVEQQSLKIIKKRGAAFVRTC